MADRFFVDTNVLLYALDPLDERKHRCAQAWLDYLWANGNGSISWQVLHEFYWNATRKMQIAESEVRRRIEDLLNWRPVDTSAGLVRDAWRRIDAAHIVYWDALIVAAAEVCGARYLLTEDLQAGRRFGAIEVVDPFGDAGSALLSTLS